MKARDHRPGAITMRNNVGTSYLASVLDLASARKAGAWKDREVLGRPSAAKSAKKWNRWCLARKKSCVRGYSGLRGTLESY